MKRKLQITYLAILPVTLFILIAIFYNSRGEFYLNGNYDGPYGLLLASLNIAQLKSPGFFQHPGVVPLLISAATIKISFLFQGINSDIVTDIFERPEFYLSRIYLVFTFLLSVSLFILGYSTYKKEKSVLAGIFLQFTPFVSAVIIFQFTRNSVEIISAVIIMLIISFSIILIHENSTSIRKLNKYAVIFGVICGFGMATKISILPILIIPFLLLKGIRFKAVFLLIAGLVFFALFLTVSILKYQFFSFLYSNIFRTERYSAGPSYFAEPHIISTQLKLIFDNFLIFSVSYVIVLVSLLLQFVPKFRYKIRANKYYLLLTGAFVIMTSFILLLVKSHINYYIMPGLLFSVAGLFMVNSVVEDLFPNVFGKKRFIYLYSFFFILTIPQLSYFGDYIKHYSLRKEESIKTINYLKKSDMKHIYITTDYVSSKLNALSNGMLYSGAELPNYSLKMKSKFPNHIYYNSFSNEFTYLKYNNDLQLKLNNSDTLIFHITNKDKYESLMKRVVKIKNKTNTEIQKLFSNKIGEEIYMVIFRD